MAYITLISAVQWLDFVHFIKGYINLTGLGPRKFRARAVEVGDQSVWTDTPADKARKVNICHEYLHLC